MFGQCHQELLTILDEHVSTEKTQVRIDSLLTKLNTVEDSEELANCYHDIASRWFFQKWRRDHRPINIKNAIEYTNRSLQIKRVIDDLESCSLNKTLYNLGYFHYLNNEPYKAEGLFKEIIEFGTLYCNKASNNKIEWTLHQLGKIYVSFGDYYKPISMYENLIHEFNANEDLKLEMKELIPFLYLSLGHAYTLTDDENNTKKNRTSI